jgi:hypothetical protein
MAMDESLTVRGGTVIARAGAAGVGALLTSTLGPEGAAATAEVLAQAGESALDWIDGRRGGRVARTLLRRYPTKSLSDELLGRLCGRISPIPKMETPQLYLRRSSLLR